MLKFLSYIIWHNWGSCYILLFGCQLSRGTLVRVPLLCCPSKRPLDGVVEFVIPPLIISLNPLVPMHPLLNIIPVFPIEGGWRLEFNLSGHRVHCACFLSYWRLWLSMPIFLPPFSKPQDMAADIRCPKICEIPLQLHFPVSNRSIFLFHVLPSFGFLSLNVI